MIVLNWMKSIFGKKVKTIVSYKMHHQEGKVPTIEVIGNSTLKPKIEHLGTGQYKFHFELNKPWISGVWKERIAMFIYHLIGVIVLYFLLKYFN
jgi:hypothetical protein